MKAWVPFVVLGGLAAAGFTIAKVMTSKGSEAEDDPNAGVDINYRAKIFLGDGGWFAVIFRDGDVIQQLGPLPTPEQAAEQGAQFLGGLDVDRFITVHTDNEGRWFFDAWSRGEAIAMDQGPYASEQVATTAGNNWISSAVGVGGCPACEAKRRRFMSAYEAGRVQ